MNRRIFNPNNQNNSNQPNNSEIPDIVQTGYFGIGDGVCYGESTLIYNFEMGKDNKKIKDFLLKRKMFLNKEIVSIEKQLQQL